MGKKHFFGCKINKFHKVWNRFTVECGITIDRECVTDNKKEVTCKNCLRLMGR